MLNDLFLRQDEQQTADDDELKLDMNQWVFITYGLT